MVKLPNMNNNWKYITILFLLTVVFLFTGTENVNAANYYVSTSGDNSNNGLTIETAWQTPSFAAQQAQAGDTIYLLDGTWYDEHIVFANSGTAGNPITMKAYSGTPQFIASSQQGITFEIISKQYINIDGPFYIKNYSHAIYMQNSSHCNISNIESELAGDVAIHLPYNNHYNTIDNCTVRDNGWNGIMIFGRSGENTYNTISNCKVINAAHNGIDLHSNVKYTKVINNEVSGSQGCAGIYAHQLGVEWNTIENNIIHDNVCWGINLPSSSNNIVKGNTIYNHKYSGITILSEGSCIIDGIEWCGQAQNNILINNKISNVNQAVGIDIAGAEGTLAINNTIISSSPYIIEPYGG